MYKIIHGHVYVECVESADEHEPNDNIKSFRWCHVKAFLTRVYAICYGLWYTGGGLHNECRWQNSLLSSLNVAPYHWNWYWFWFVFPYMYNPTFPRTLNLCVLMEADVQPIKLPPVTGVKWAHMSWWHRLFGITSPGMTTKSCWNCSVTTLESKVPTSTSLRSSLPQSIPCIIWCSLITQKN